MASTYRLGPVRDRRARVEQGNKHALADAVSEARATAAEVEVAAARVATVRARLAIAAPPLAGAAARTLADRYLARRRRELAEARVEEARARASHAGRLDAIDTSRGALAAARAEKEVIERHFARWREQQRKLAEARREE